jgi:C1A family cysteine protease
MQQALNEQTVSIAVNARQWNFKYYESGVLEDCVGDLLDHAVAAVGYDTEDGKDYWIVRNSWGADWGDHGYIKVAFGACGADREAMYPHTNDE